MELKNKITQSLQSTNITTVEATQLLWVIHVSIWLMSRFKMVICKIFFVVVTVQRAAEQVCLLFCTGNTVRPRERDGRGRKKGAWKGWSSVSRGVSPYACVWARHLCQTLERLTRVWKDERSAGRGGCLCVITQLVKHRCPLRKDYDEGLMFTL